MISRKTVLVTFLIILVIAHSPILRSEEDLHRVWAVKDCRIVTQAGPLIEKGTVVIRNGLIEAVGAQVAIPSDAEVVDGSRLTVYPGLIDPLGKSLIKLPEQKFDQTKMLTGQYTDEDRGIKPEFKAFDHFEITKSTLEKYHKAGFTAAQVLPERGVFTGQASVFSLSGMNKNTSIILRDTCLGVGFSVSSFMVYPSSLMGVVAMLRQEFSDAAYFDKHNTRWMKEMKGILRPEYSLKHEMLSDYATGRKPVVFLCRNQNDILRAIDMAGEMKLDYFICDLGNEGFRVIPELKKAKARLFLPLTFKAPSTSIHAQKGRDARDLAEEGLYPKNPVKLAEAGIPFTFTSFGTDDPSSFREGIQKAMQNGLPQEKALDALTIGAARFLKLEKALGTIEPGKMANLALVEGDILAKEAKVKYVFADGTKFELKEAAVKEGEKPTVNITGKWEISIEEAGLKLTMDFVQEEAALSGKLTTPFGVFDFSGGTVSGNQVYFEMNLSVGGQDIDLYFTGIVEDDKMTGSVVQGTEGATDFTAKRIPGMGGTR
ncbi:MAG: amidohydrolase family protein [Candidatus Aminicenantes bacterium]|nr:MAG: amidohydrolase family protein [Candidatus Aminicenantes bacterium]